MSEQQGTPTYPQAEVQLTGANGNAFNIIGRVQYALTRDVSQEASDAWVAEAYQCESYDELLALCLRTLIVL